MCDVCAAVEGFVKGVYYPAVDDFDVQDFCVADRAYVVRLTSFVGMEYDRIYGDFAIADGVDLDLGSAYIRICPI